MRSIEVRWLIPVAMCTWLAAGDALAQSTRELSAEPTCRRCTIEITTVAILGNPSDSIILGATSASVAMTSRGRFLVPAASAFQVAVYDSAGRFVGAFGRRGPGPGELRSVSDIRIGPGDSVFVADMRNGVQVFGPDLNYARAVRIPNPGSFATALLLPSGEIVQQTGGSILSVIAADGTARESIPLSTIPTSPACPSCRNNRWLTAARTPGHFWTTVADRYAIQEIDREGTVHRTLTRRPSWFPPRKPAAPAAPGTSRSAPLASLGPAREDSTGVLWTLASVPDPKWHDTKRGGPVSVALFNSLSDAIVTALDPRAGTVLAETRLPGPVGFVGSSTLIFSQEEDSDGFVRLHILRLRLKRG